MIHEDYERDFLKDVIYLQERLVDLERQIIEEINRNAAIIKVVKDDSKGDIQEIRNLNPARVYVGYDLPFEDDSRGVRCGDLVSNNSQAMSTLSNDSQEATSY